MTNEAVRSLSFEIGSDQCKDEESNVGKSDSEQNSEEREQPNDELMAALAGLDSDFDIDAQKTAQKRAEKSAAEAQKLAEESLPKTKPEFEVKIEVTSSSLLSKKFKGRKLSTAQYPEPEVKTELLENLPKPEIKSEPASLPENVIAPSSLPAGLPDEMKEFSDDDMSQKLKIVEDNPVTTEPNRIQISPRPFRRVSQPEIESPVRIKERRLSTVSGTSDTTVTYVPTQDATNLIGDLNCNSTKKYSVEKQEKIHYFGSKKI